MVFLRHLFQRMHCGLHRWPHPGFAYEAQCEKENYLRAKRRPIAALLPLAKTVPIAVLRMAQRRPPEIVARPCRIINAPPRMGSADVSAKDLSRPSAAVGNKSASNSPQRYYTPNGRSIQATGHRARTSPWTMGTQRLVPRRGILKTSDRRRERRQPKSSRPSWTPKTPEKKVPLRRPAAAEMANPAGAGIAVIKPCATDEGWSNTFNAIDGKPITLCFAAKRWNQLKGCRSPPIRVLAAADTKKKRLAGRGQEVKFPFLLELPWMIARARFSGTMAFRLDEFWDRGQENYCRAHARGRRAAWAPWRRCIVCRGGTPDGCRWRQSGTNLQRQIASRNKASA